MIRFSVKDLASIINADYSAEADIFFTDVSIDSRTVKQGDCFFAIKGESFDGHDFIADALKKEAVCAVVEKSFDVSHFPEKTMLKVDNTIDALGRFAAEFRRRMNLKVIAITGSAGKTTTRHIIAHALSSKYSTLQSPKNFNNNIGLPLTLLAATPSNKIAVVELGSNHPGEIGYLTRITKPDIAIVTNVYPSHLAGFGKLQTIVNEKLSISEGLSDESELIINGDIDYLTNAARKSHHSFITFGTSGHCDVKAEDINLGAMTSTFVVDGRNLFLPLPGRGNIENALGAWATCRKFGLGIEEFASSLKTLRPISMRAEVIGVGNLKIINDCYNANPASMKNALQILANLSSSGANRSVFICGDMGELGENSDKIHAELGCFIAKAGVKLLIAVGPYSKITAEAAKKQSEYDLTVKCFKDNLSACNNVQEFIRDSDIILVKGSRSAKLELVVEKIKELFGK
ncbi:MAG: UDP-N-acetylmuramoyl-tripeptide--D-alanyl-D-alanine ligase [Planctomycetota bacterium]|jgi:UDP-N-acetylmuramoyl-tripeptide--D-alanyl-D-alanine ligase